MPSNNDRVAPHTATMPSTLDVIDRELINLLQRGIPLCPTPFAWVAQALQLQEQNVLQRLQRLLADGFLSRFGPMFQIERAGGRFTLAAIAVPPARYDEVAAQVNAFPEVAHNYERTHRLNMWFVVATESPEHCAATLQKIEAVTGLPVLDMPKQNEFRVQLYFDARIEGDGSNAGQLSPVSETRLTLSETQLHPSETQSLRSETAVQLAGPSLDANDRALMRATQAGLPLVPHPFAEVGRALGLAEDAVLARFKAWQANGVLRRVAAVPNHYALGYVHNGMTVWDVDDATVDALGKQVAALGFVSHCYRRPRHGDDWPYNLFAMVHGRSRAHTEQQVARIAATLGGACHAHDVLWSTRILKKTGLRIGGALNNEE